MVQKYSRPRPKLHCVRRGPSSFAKEAQQPPPFGPCLLWPQSPFSAAAELLLFVVTFKVCVSVYVHACTTGTKTTVPVVRSSLI